MEIASPLNGGAGFAGKSGRKTANVCDTQRNGDDDEYCCTLHVRRS